MTCFLLFNSTPTTEIYTLSLHDALPISGLSRRGHGTGTDPVSQPGKRPADLDGRGSNRIADHRPAVYRAAIFSRSEEHTSELQSRQYLVCRLLLEKKKNRHQDYPTSKG